MKRKASNSTLNLFFFFLHREIRTYIIHSFKYKMHFSLFILEVGTILAFFLSIFHIPEHLFFFILNLKRNMNWKLILKKNSYPSRISCRPCLFQIFMITGNGTRTVHDSSIFQHIRRINNNGAKKDRSTSNPFMDVITVFRQCM